MDAKAVNQCCDITWGTRQEEVISENDICKEAHRQLFRFDEKIYTVTNGSVRDEIEDRIKAGALRLHLTGTWPWMLKIALQKDDKPERGDVFYLLKLLGLNDEELQPFASADINDIFYSLYYGKRFDILRRLCHRAKKEVEKSVNNPSITIHCHLVAPEITQIVASSL